MSLQKAAAITDPRERAIALARIAWDESQMVQDERGEVVAFVLSGAGLLAFVELSGALEQIEDAARERTAR